MLSLANKDIATYQRRFSAQRDAGPDWQWLVGPNKRLLAK
jgi:hypothetical protein